MSTSVAPAPAGVSPSIPLRFAITMDELLRMGHQSALASRGDWIRRLAAIGAACLAVHFAVQREWLIASLTALLACTLWSRYWLMQWLVGLWLRGTVDCDLVVDPVGIRGELQSQMRLRSLSEYRRFNYAWNRLRKIERVSDCLVFEFHGGSGTMIPVSAFSNAEDLQQCEAWAENGIALQRAAVA